MANFPTAFVDKPIQLVAGLGPAGDAAIKELQSKGFSVLVGLTEEFAQSIAEMAKQQHIRDYCPRDSTSERFGTIDSTKRWLSAGRAFFVLAKSIGDDAWVSAGYGWTGAKKSPEIPGGETTFAVRVGELGLGQKLSEPFSRLIILASQKMYGAEHFWLETWQSNTGATHVYEKLGFKLVSSKPSGRQSADSGLVDDVRLFMRLES